MSTVASIIRSNFNNSPSAPSLGRVDPYTGEIFNWKTVTKYWDGTDMTDEKVDGVLYLKEGGVYLQRVVRGNYDAAWWGIIPDAFAATKHDAAIAKAHATIPLGGTLYFGGFPGSYGYNDTIMWSRRVNFVGDGKCTFRTPMGKTAMRVVPSARGAVFENYMFHSAGLSTTDGKAGGAAYTDLAADYQFHGMDISAVITIRNVTCRNMSGHGFYHHANIAADQDDASNCKVYDCFSYQNKGAGFYSDGPDANSIKYISCSAHDNGLVGFWDSSFLGNHYYGCMTHYNRLGDFRTDDNNARSTIVGPYSEGGSPASTFAPLATIIGGIMESGVEGGFWQQGQHARGLQKWGNMVFSQETIDFWGMKMARRGTHTNWGFGTAGGFENTALGMVGPNSQFYTPNDTQSPTITNPLTLTGNVKARSTQVQASYTPHIYIAGRLHTGFTYNFAANIALAPFNAIQWVVGDFITNIECNGITPAGWRCVANGTGGAAKFRAEGTGAGTLAQRPALRTNEDAGWRYFSTDNNTWTTWNGTTYI